MNSSVLKRISFVKNIIGDNKYFFLTYGDSIAEFNKKKILNSIKEKKIIVSLYKKKIDYGVVKIDKKK